MISDKKILKERDAENVEGNTAHTENNEIF